jgi:AcrR family transcriptional regulator
MPVKADRKAYHHGDLRAALLKAALKLIDAHGVKGFSLKDAAKMAGVSVAAPYRHFADKDALLEAIQVEGFGLFNAALSDAFASAATADARIEELGVAYVLFALRHPAHFRVMFGVRGTGGPPEEHSPSELASGFELLVRGVAELHPEASAAVRHDMVLACWSVVHGFAMLQMETAFVGMTEIPAIERQLRRTLRMMIGMDITARRG